MPRPLTNRYFRIWSPEMFGPDPDGFDMRKDLEPQERWCWDALRGMCSMSSLQPAVCKSPLIGFTDNEFAETMAVQPFVWKGCKQKLILAGKIDVDSQNVIVIRNWDRNAAKYFRGHAYRDGALRVLSAEEELRLRGIDKEKATLFARVIKHLNDTAGRNFKLSCKSSFGRVSARFDEGYRWEDFKHVIEVKCQQWLGNEKMEGYLRPQTLFNGEGFEAYRQEHLVVRNAPVGGSGSMTIFSEERAKYEAEAKADYEHRKVDRMKELGAKTEEDWYNLILKGQAPMFEEFFKIFLKRKRESGGWSLEPERGGEEP